MRILRTDETYRRLGLKRAYFFELMKAGKLPLKKVKVTDEGRTVGYVESEVDDYIRSRMELRDKAAA